MTQDEAEPLDDEAYAAAVWADWAAFVATLKALDEDDAD
jgi:hypothetical protein